MNLMDLFIKLVFKDEASEKIMKVTHAVGNGMKKAAKVGAAAMGAASAAVGTLVTQSVKAYADYEQLVGGIETLFSNLEGTVSAAPQVLANAAKAYETAGLSANQYMETVTSFSAALVAGLGNDYEEAARISDMAITDMADNANKMGTSMDSIQAAYQGFAKQNYTMLDNLKLGYGGTKTEMERLLADAEKITGVKYDISNLADVYTAIHVIQGEIGITGATAKEAATTITGSLNMLKASWANLLTGLGTENANIEELFDDLAQAAETFLGNVIPVVERVFDSIGRLLIKKVPELGKKLPKILQKLLPGLIEGATGLISGLAKALPDILLVILQQLPALVDSALTIGKAVIDGFIEGIPKLFGAIWTALDDAMSGVDENGNQQSSYWINLWDRIKTAASNALDTIREKVEVLREPFQRMSESWTTLKAHIDEIVKKIQKWEEEHHALERIFDFVSTKIQAGIYIIEGALELLNLRFQEIDMFLTGIETLFDAVKKAGAEAADWIKSHWEELSDVIGGVAKVISPLGAFAGWIGGGGNGRGHAGGLDYVPYDNYPALLHRKEAVLTAREADAWRRGAGNGQQIVNNFTFNGVSQSDLDYIVGYVNRELVSG